MPLRNPFKRSANGLEIQDEPASRQGAERGFKPTEVVGVKPIDIKEPPEYKLSEINDSGVYLPPSPPERKPFWHTKSSGSTTSSNHRSVMSENEPFNISRESFDSYRRSFDISARSPIPDYDRSRQSLDQRPRQSQESRRALQTRSLRPSFDQSGPMRGSSDQSRPIRPSFDQRGIDRPVEEGFEEVGLNDEVKPKKRGLFSRFGDSADTSPQPSSDGKQHHHISLFTGRKRGQSGQGAELGNMNRPATPQTIEAPAQ